MYRESAGRADLGQYQSSSEPPRKKPKKKKHTGLKIVIVLLLLIALPLVGIRNYVFKDFSSDEFKASEKELGILPEAKNKDLIHIAILGIDSLDGDAGRSDCTMIATLDTKHKQIKLTSVLRDSYLPMEGHGHDKLTHAYAYGGETLTLHTLNQNFGLDIRNYVVLNYQDVMQMIDVVDGLDLEITERERKEINRIAKEMDEDAESVEENGMVHLNGLQATAYARIRKIDSETIRTERQRTVIQLLLEKCKSQGVFSYPKLAREFLKHMKTSLKKSEIQSMLIKVLSYDFNIKQYVVPSEEDHAIGGSYAGFWCWRYDVDEAADRLHEFLDNKIEDPSTEG